ncbi:hypothetical protein [Archaeoglobus sulfaticallidus]|uniref:hypothetical protein n=1 Tax=Archaeoglobus sulfaticallidus TaxID=1316941 RepID=UPI0011818627|nr:hypothetical protein [Archaeoglobus sulfaticallidus]
MEESGERQASYSTPTKSVQVTQDTSDSTSTQSVQVQPDISDCQVAINGEQVYISCPDGRRYAKNDGQISIQYPDGRHIMKNNEQLAIQGFSYEEAMELIKWLENLGKS